MKVKSTHHHTLIWIIAVLLAVTAGIVGFMYFFISPKMSSENESTQVDKSPGIDEKNYQIPYKAAFNITINNQTRTFNSGMYFNQSEEVYIAPEEPNEVVVNRQGVTWQAFFDTLPFKMGDTCIITGNKETYCNTVNQKITFVLNGTEDPKALSRVIAPGDNLAISY